MTSTIESIRAEYLRYKALAEAAIAQVEDSDLSMRGSGTDNSEALRQVSHPSSTVCR